MHEKQNRHKINNERDCNEHKSTHTHTQKLQIMQSKKHKNQFKMLNSQDTKKQRQIKKTQCTRNKTKETIQNKKK